MIEKSKRSTELHEQLSEFMDQHIYPNEALIKKEIEEGERWQPSEIVEGLKREAQEVGLWNLFLPESDLGAGLTNFEYAPLCEVMGRSPYAPEVSIVPHPIRETWKFYRVTAPQSNKQSGWYLCSLEKSVPHLR